MSPTFVNLVVIGVLGFTLFLAVYTYASAKKKKSGSQSASKAFEDWMTSHHFLPDHSCLFGGTGIAFRHLDKRLALQSKGTIHTYEPADIVSIKAYASTVSSRPLGAAPGVVEVRQIQIFNLDIAVKDVADPIRILLPDEDQMHQWNQRIGALIEPS